MTSQLDFFAAPVSPTAARAARPSVAVNEMGRADDEAMARHLEATGNYRILRKLQPRLTVEHPRPEFQRRGVILDTETTGLNQRTDEIIELGAIAFTFNDEGELGDVMGIYGGLQQPTIPIPADISSSLTMPALIAPSVRRFRRSLSIRRGPVLSRKLTGPRAASRAASSAI